MSCYHHLTISEREILLILKTQGHTIRSIARFLGRAPSTISRELNRNEEEYRATRAQQAYCSRRKRCVRKNVLSDPELHHWVHFFLGYLYWSPEQISRRLSLEGYGSISTSTIYRGLENGLLQDTLRYYLRFKYNIFGKSPKKNRKCFARSIEERPPEAKERGDFGHWEGDTVAGRNEKACIVTLVDRKSRMLLAGKADSKKSEDVTRVVVRLLARTNRPVKSITFDRGTEFADMIETDDKLDTKVYFAHPHSPWERPSNENTNGLLRQFIRKGHSIAPYSHQDLQSITARLNLRPRKCLGWRTPYEVFSNQVLHFI